MSVQLGLVVVAALRKAEQLELVAQAAVGLEQIATQQELLAQPTLAAVAAVVDSLQTLAAAVATAAAESLS